MIILISKMKLGFGGTHRIYPQTHRYVVVLRLALRPLTLIPG